MANEQEKKSDIKPVVTGKVTKKQKGLLAGFIQEDAKTIASSIKDDIIVPTLKDVIFNTARTAIEMMLWGESSGGYTSHTGGVRRSGGTNYNGMYTNRQSSTPARKGAPHSRYEVAIVEFEQRLDAEAVLDILSDHMERYGCFSIADYYKACNQPYEYTDENYGWYDMRGMGITHLRGGGWTIEFRDKAIPLGE